MLRAVQIFRLGVGGLLLTAAGCDPVRDELFVAEPRPMAGMSPAPMAGMDVVPRGGVGGADGEAGRGPITVTFGGTGGSDPRLDPHATFGWVETIPGGGSCAQAMFTGTFSCKLDGGLEADVLEGVVTMTLIGSSETQALAVTQPQLLLYDDGMKQVLVAPFTGGLNCNSQALSVEVPPTMTDPLSIDRQVLWLIPTPQPNVSGTLKGALDRDTQAITGDVNLMFQPGPKCTGTFSVRATP